MKIADYRPTLLIAALYKLTFWRIVVHHVTFERWKSELNSRHSLKIIGKEKKHNDIQTSLEINKHINCVRRHTPLEFNCMHRCFALKSMLNKQEIFPSMCIGVKIDSKGLLQAHAWLTLHGELINDTRENISQYQQITDTQSVFKYTFDN